MNKLVIFSGTPQFNENQVRLYLHTNTVFLQLFVENHKWRIASAGQVMVVRNEKRKDLESFYGNESPWIRLWFERRSNNFFLGLLAVPVAVVVLAGLFFVGISDPNVNCVVALFEVLFLSGLHVALLQLIPASTTMPVFGMSLSPIRRNSCHFPCLHIPCIIVDIQSINQSINQGHCSMIGPLLPYTSLWLLDWLIDK